MTYAYRCDECDTFEEGDPTLTLSMEIEGDDSGFMGRLFGVNGGPSETYDFCSLTCAEAFEFGPVRDSLIADIDDKHGLLESESPGAEEVPEL